MTNADFTALRNYLLAQHSWFTEGFANVFQDETTGLIMQGDSSEKFGVGIQDDFGNYFYIRTDSDIRYTDSRPQLSDTSRKLDETVRCYLVAVVENARPKDLVQSLLNSLLTYGDQRIRPQRAVFIREFAVAKELSKLDKGDVQAALQRLGTWQVVTLEFDFITSFAVTQCTLPLPFDEQECNC